MKKTQTNLGFYWTKLYILIYNVFASRSKRMYQLDQRPRKQMNDSQVRDYIQKVQTQLKKSPPVKVDPQTGCINVKYDMKWMDEDIYIPGPRRSDKK